MKIPGIGVFLGSFHRTSLRTRLQQAHSKPFEDASDAIIQAGNVAQASDLPKEFTGVEVDASFLAQRCLVSNKHLLDPIHTVQETSGTYMNRNEHIQ